jgi:hypothetical protein
MAELGELTDANLADVADSDKCPFCGNAPHGFGDNKKKKPSLDVKSIPSDLGCSSIPGAGKGKHTTAAHHLICAIQCYKQVRRLVRMGSLVGYNINSSPNGMPLPTVCNPYKGKNFSKLSDKKKNGISEQDEIAFERMDATQAQWHVGHHSFEITIEDYDVSEGGDDSEYLHLTSYDNEVIRLLLRVTTLFQEDELCEEKEGNGDEFIAQMDNISEFIKAQLEKFKTTNPYASGPFFVSDRAQQYAKAIRKGVWKRGAQ